MNEPQDYSVIVGQAERAVASVKDPDLKRIAFQRVLDDLLGSSQPKENKVSIRKSPKVRTKGAERSASKTGPKAHIEELIEDGFFKKPKPISEVRTALENLGHHIPLTSLSGPLQKLCQQKQLRRQKLAESKSYAYSEW
ncbi:MAG TPA: hypothetical protein VE111_04745 [Bradyrhizobium sp.]|nr:hypothetical protein [Bradyrhizobium sp.]